MIAQIQIRRGTTAEWAAADPVVLAAGEQGYDSTLKRLKIGDGTTAWASLPWTDYGTNPNILHNWDFRINPVNQRASTGAISSGYFYDRWMRYAGTITINATYLSMPADASIEQRIEGLGLSGKAVTVSILLGDAVISGQGTFPTSAGTESVTLTGFGTATLGYHADYMFVRITATDSTRNLQAVKLELGTVSTLAYDPPMDWAVELAKCQRYFIALDTYPWGYGYADSATIGEIKLGLPCVMRIDPTINVSVCTIVQPSGAVVAGTLSTVLQLGNGQLNISFSGSGLTQYTPITASLGGGTAVMLSADL